jgi:hypothetical protein
MAGMYIESYQSDKPLLTIQCSPLAEALVKVIFWKTPQALDERHPWRTRWIRKARRFPHDCVSQPFEDGVTNEKDGNFFYEPKCGPVHGF